MAENPNDLCSQPAEGSVSSNKALSSSQSSSKNTSSSSSSTNSNKSNNDSSIATEDENGALDFTPLVKNVKRQIDKLIDPLTKKPKKSGKYWSLEKIDDEEYVETWTEVHGYEIINMDPDNPWDQYYRDPDPLIWQKNREANTNEIARNIQELHDTIVDPIRIRTRMVFGDNVFIKTELCFMSKAALTKYGLKNTHIHGKGKAIVLRIVNERASMIYDDILDWCSDKTDDELSDYAKTEEEKTLEPINYGMMKLCNTESEDQFIYITLPFTESELENDELLIHNKSNFYYTEANDFKMAPEPDTSTKIFPAYYEDNNAEDVFNKLDDLDDEISRKEKEIQKAIKNNSNSTSIKRLEKEKFELEFEKNLLLNPSNLSKLELEKEKLNKLNEKYPSKQNENNLAKINDKINRYPSPDDTFSITINKINSLELYLSIENNLTFDTSDYFNAKRLIAIKIALECIKMDNFVPNEEEINKSLESAKSTYEIVYKERQRELYNSKVEELYPDGLENVDNVPYIEVDYSTIDMSDYRIPSRDELIEEQRIAFEKRADLLKEVYNTMDFIKLENNTIDTKMNLVSYTEEEMIDIENFEYNKFASLKCLVELNNYYKIVLNKKHSIEQYKQIDQYIIDTNLNNEFLSILDTNLDFLNIREYYFNKKKIELANEENINEKISNSILFSDILIRNDLEITMVPSINTSDYAEFVLKYLDCEIELYTNLSNQEMIDKLTEIKTEWSKDKENCIYNNIDLNKIKSDLILFTLFEYNATKGRKITDLSTDETNIDNMLLNKLALYQIDYRSNLSNNVSYTACSYIGKDSFNDQSIRMLLKNYLNDEQWRIDNNIDNITISSILSTQINNLIDYIDNKITSLNDYLKSYNEYILSILYTEDQNIIINKLYNENKYNYIFKDYGTEYETLYTQIGELKINKEKTQNEIEYMSKLKSSRIERKHELEYITSNENNKKIQNYLDELPFDIEYGKINKYKEIVDTIIPELQRINEVRDHYNTIKPIDTSYEEKKELQRSRLEFLWRNNINNKYLMYSYLTSDITMDYTHNEGVFKNSLMNKNEKYLKYLELLLDILVTDNNSLMDTEITQIRKEIAYIKNENGEKIAERDRIVQEIKNKKQEISKEISKRENDPMYNHFVIWKNSLEETMKLKYKCYIRIESLPSTGPVFKYPFLLFNELKSEYIDYIRNTSDRIISNLELIDLYRLYTTIDFNMFEVEKNFYFNKINDLWKNVNYKPDLNSFSNDINQIALCIGTGVDNNIQKNIIYCLKSVYGFIDMQPILISENNIGYSTILIVDIKRDNSFKDDLLYLIETMFGVQTDNLIIDIKNKNEVL